MLKKYYKKFNHNKYIVKLNKVVDARNLWVFNRKSVSGGIALGVACAWIPLPFHTIIAIFFAVLFDCNIPLVAASIWFANPITMPFMYYFAYRLGEIFLGIHITNIHFHLNVHDMLIAFREAWEPFLLGCFISGISLGLLMYLIVNMIWPSIDRRLKK